MFSNIKNGNKYKKNNNHKSRDNKAIDSVINVLDQMLDHNNMVRNNIIKLIKKEFFNNSSNQKKIN